MKKKLAAVVAATTVSIAGMSTPAWAAGSDSSISPSEVVDVLAASAPDTLSQRANVGTSANGDEATAKAAGGQTGTVNLDAGEGVQLKGASTPQIQLGLPFASQSSDGELVARGVVAFDNNNDTLTVPVLKNDGTVQVTTIIESKNAAQRFDYPVSVSGGARLEAEADGSVTILSADGKYVGGIAAPWAKDANGAPVPTHYEIAGNVLTQVVEHQASSAAYPVTADPWLGADLIQSTRWSNPSQGWRLSITPTTWGKTTGAAARWAAWDEVKAKTPGTRENTEVMEKQLLCHFDGRAAVIAREGWNATWDLESWRPNVSYAAYVQALCNP